MKILGIITARGGSKRVPHKNVKEFLRKPLLAWTIEVGKEAGVFDKFILSTDNKEIAEVGEKYGVEVPFIRPNKLAGDTTGSSEVVKHAIEWLKENENYEADWIIVLEPSSPGRQAKHIKEVAKLIQERDDFDSITGVSEVPGHFSHLKQLNSDDKGVVTRVGDNSILRNLIHRNQDVPKSFFINSAIYAFKTKNLYNGNNGLWGNSTYGYIMDEKYALDIDTPDDWIIAEVKMKKLLKEQ
jgi:CMP-N-acetylneuraminic acid synthetase|tara:strand:+ start:5383 stop:6105 length:723 start_codon:yes stop_codon:yes gene_type:complete